MPGNRAPKEIRQRRHAYAAEMLAKGHPFTTVVASVADEWGCSRRRARDVVRAALDEVVSDTEAIDAKQLLADNVRRLQRLAMRAEQCGQFGAAVGAIRTLNDTVVFPSISAQNRRQGLG